MSQPFLFGSGKESEWTKNGLIEKTPELEYSFPYRHIK